MSNANKALPLALGAGGGFLLWYILRDSTPAGRAAAPAATAKPSGHAAESLTGAATSVSARSAAEAPPPCALRLDALALTADGVRVGLVEAVDRCKRAGRADVTVTQEASATTYADLMTALSRAEVLVYAHGNGKRAVPRNAKLPPSAPLAEEDVDLPSFALMVEALAADVEPDPNPQGRARGRFGDRKVFIAAIRRALRATKYRSLPRAAIDELLIRAHREELLQLARADLVAAMDPDEVRDSEISYGRLAQFHFVIDEPDPGRNTRRGSDVE